LTMTPACIKYNPFAATHSRLLPGPCELRLNVPVSQKLVR
jgi:hypothetical protein